MHDFDFLEPTSVAEASRLLAELGEDCRVIAVTEGEGIDPYAGPPRPRIVTSDDYKKDGGEGV